MENNKNLRDNLDRYFNEDLSEVERKALENEFYSNEEMKQQFDFEKDFINSLEKVSIDEIKESFDASHEEMELENSSLSSSEMEAKDLSTELEYNITDLYSKLNNLKTNVIEI